MADPTSAYDRARAQYAEWGLSSLTDTLLKLSEEGLDDDTFLLKLRATSEYKIRFSGNASRLAAGMRVLSEAEYLSKEEALRAQLSDPEWGLPKEFYDSSDDYAKMIGADLGAAEIQSRLQGIKTVITDGKMNGVMEYARANYGLGTGELMAMWLDPERAAPVLARISKASAIGAAAKRAAYGAIEKEYAERLDALGVSAEQAAGGFSEAASLNALTQEIGGDAGVARDDVTKAIFEQDAGAKQRVERTQNQRRSRFAGGGGFSESKEGIAGLGSANR